MDYNQTMEYIRELNQKKGMVFGLSTMKSLLDALGVRRDFDAVHVAGTNGKGSLCNFTAEILMRASYKVGIYTSPAVGDDLEIIRINKKNITKTRFAKLFTRAVNVALEIGIFPTAYELQTAVAFMYFMEEECDICVIECGLGGRLDATNVLTKPLITAFASIGMDHMHILGNTIADIAREKAGIIKNGATAVCQQSDDKAIAVLESVCFDKKVDLIATEDAQNIVTYDNKTVFSYRGYRDLIIRQPGLYQVYNACEAVDIARTLTTYGYNITLENIYDGLYKSKLKFRYETISKSPRIIVDGAHNENAIKRLMENVSRDFKDKKLIYVCGMFKDKDYKEAMRILTTHSSAKEYITITPPGSRGLKSSELAKVIKDMDKDALVNDSENVHCAVEYILQKASKDDIILAFGSLSYLKEFSMCVRDYYRI